MKAEIKDNFLDGAGLVVLVPLILAKRCAQLGGDFHFTDSLGDFHSGISDLKMPRSERVILHVSINMGRLPGERKGVEQMLERSSSTILKRSLFIEGNIPKCPYFQF